MTREQAKELLPVIEAWANGQVVQVHQFGKWSDVEVLETLDWTKTPSHYRLKPTPKRVPLGPDDVPPGSVIRDKSWTCSKWVAIIQCDELGVWWHCCDRARSQVWASLVEGWEISRDNGKTWLPCWKEAVE